MAPSSLTCLSSIRIKNNSDECHYHLRHWSSIFRHDDNGLDYFDDNNIRNDAES